MSTAMLFVLRSQRTRVVSRSMSVLESRRFQPDLASRPVDESRHRYSTLVNPEDNRTDSVKKARGLLTGWNSVDKLYTVVPGELTIVTGIPNYGRSEWIDSLALYHAIKLMEKHLKKPFFNQDCGRTVERMSREEMNEAKEWVAENFYMIRSEMSHPSIDWVLERAKAAVVRYGIQGLVIDPYNLLDHQRTNQTESQYVSQLLTKIKQFAEYNSCHVWLVAHAPNLYDISGSAHFFRKCDSGIIIHRNRDENAGPLDLVQVGVRKVRNSVAGRIGDAYLSYDRATGLYSESPVALIKKRP